MIDSIKLMKKDIYLVFKINRMNIFVIIYPISMSCIILTSDLTISIQTIMSATAYAVYAILVGLISNEEKTKASMIFQSLPIKKQSIVVGKYMLTTAVIVVASFLSSIFPIIKSFVEKDISYLVLSILNSFMFCTIIFSIFLPLYFKYGYLKMQAINLIIFYGLIFIPIILNLLRDKVLIRPITSFLYNIINLLMQNSILAIIGCAVIYILSMIVSIRLENNK